MKKIIVALPIASGMLGRACSVRARTNRTWPCSRKAGRATLSASRGKPGKVTA